MRCALLLAFVLAPAAASGQLQWGSSFDAARTASARSNKPILVDFMATWCGPCRKMDEETFPDSRVKALLQKMILVRLDVDRSPPQAKQYGVNSIPRLILIPPGGGAPMMDLMGYRDADTLLDELRQALGMKPESVPQAPKTDPNMLRVRQALESNQFPALKSADPKAAAAGLERLVEQLGVTKEADFAPVAALIQKAGDDAIPALIHGMGSPFLAVRAGAFRALQETLRPSAPTMVPAFDPWAAPAKRKLQLQKWEQWLAARKNVLSPRKLSSLLRPGPAVDVIPI